LFLGDFAGWEQIDLFFKLPADELQNHISLGDLWSAEANLLRERLLKAVTPAAKFQVLKDCLIDIDVAFNPLQPMVQR
jgi:hypothetical protein